MTLNRVLSSLLLSVLILSPLGAVGSPAQAQEATPAAQAVAAGPAHLGGDLPGDPQIQLVEVASGMANPVNLAFPPDDSGRMFVVGVGGEISIVDADGNLLPDLFLDLSRTVALRPGQQGLLGLAFHPNFAENGRFYVAFNNLFANGALSLSEFQVDPENPNVAVPKSERPLLVIDKPYPQHNGGTLRFGPDGYLYMATGDGGWQGDPYDNAQSRFSLLGKILRIDVDGSTDGHPYGIPADNPFTGPGRYDNPYPGQEVAPLAEEAEDAGAEEPKGRKRRNREGLRPIAPENRRLLSPVRKEIWAFGFRNPWQFSFDPLTNDLYIADVGAENWEEINFQPADSPGGQNYGWDWLEASHCFPAEITDCSRGQVGLLPVAEYEHGDDGCAVIGLGVYRAKESPELDGIYFSGEYCTGEIRGLQRDDNGVWQFQNLLDTALQITGSGQDAMGNVYVTAVTSRRGSTEDAPNGSIWRLVAADKVPEGATTVPLGEPSGGDVEVDEEGNPIDVATDEAEGESAVEEQAAEETAAPTATPTADASTGAATEVTIAMHDIFFEPVRVRIPANTDVRILLPNEGQTVHNFELKERGVDVSVDVEAGETGEAILNLPPGNYKFVCNIPGHKQAGMTGVLVAVE